MSHTNQSWAQGSKTACEFIGLMRQGHHCERILIDIARDTHPNYFPEGGNWDRVSTVYIKQCSEVPAFIWEWSPAPDDRFYDTTRDEVRINTVDTDMHDFYEYKSWFWLPTFAQFEEYMQLKHLADELYFANKLTERALRAHIRYDRKQDDEYRKRISEV